MSSGGKLLSQPKILTSPGSQTCAEADIIIEPVNWRDLQAVRSIEQESYVQDAYPFLEILGMLTLPGFIRMKAVTHDQLAGFIFAEGFSDSEYDWITAIRVSKTFQRCGIGTSLLLNCEKQLKKNIIRLCVRQANLRQSSYIRNVVINKPQSGTAIITMAKML